MREEDLEGYGQDDSSETAEKSTLSPRAKTTLKALSGLKSPRRDDDAHQQSRLENDESPPKSQRRNSTDIIKFDPYLLATDQLNSIKATVSAKLVNYYQHVKKNLIHSKHILAESFNLLLPSLDLKSFILCSLWLQTPYDEGEFKSILEAALYQLAHLDYEDKEASNSMTEDEFYTRDTFIGDEETPYELFVRTYPNPDTRNIILLSQLNTQFPQILSGDIAKERMLNHLIYKSSLPKVSLEETYHPKSQEDEEETNSQKSQEDDVPTVEKDYSREIEHLRSDKNLIAWEVKMKTLAHLSEFIKRCVLDKPYKAALAAASSPIAKFFTSKIKALGNKVNNTLDVTKKSLELALKFMHLLTITLPDDDYQAALDDLLLEIEEDEQVANGGLIQILNRYLIEIRPDEINDELSAGHH